MDLISVFEKVRQPFNINSIALAAANIALVDQSFLALAVKNNLDERNKVAAFFDAAGIDYLSSQANFLTFNVGGNADACYRFLLAQGVVVRPLKAYGMSDWLRVSIGLASENNTFIAGVQLWLER